MKHTRKILIALLLVMTLMVSMATIFASAAETPEKLYLTPNANWKQDGARFAARFWTNTPSFSEQWVDMKDPDGDGIYECQIPEGMEFVIICRMNPGNAANGWDTKWNQTSDLTLPTNGTNHYIVKEDTWDSGGGNWATYGSTCLHTNLGDAATCTTPQICLDCEDPVVSALGHAFNEAHLCTRCNVQASFTVAGSGAHLGTEWDTGNTANDMTYADGVYTKVYENVAAGSYAFKVVRDHSWGTAYPSANKEFTVETAGSTVTITLKGTEVEIAIEAPKPEAPAHVNALAVGDTNKIVVTGNTLNSSNLPIEWVEFVVTEKAHYEFSGDTYAFVYSKMDLADFTACVCGFTGKADLEPGTYYICIGGVATGEFNIKVTKTEIKEPETPAHVNTLVVGDTNKIVVTGNTLNSSNLPIEWVEFVVTEKAHYEFSGDTYAFVYSKMDLADFTACVCGFTGKADLEPGTYYICIGGVATGEFNIKVTKTEISEGGEEEDKLPTLALGDNTVTIDGSETNLAGNAVAWYTFTPIEAGTYKFACDDLTVYILSSKNIADGTAYIGAGGVAELEADTKYYILLGKDGVKGEFTVKVENGAAPVHVNTVVVGDNKYIISDALLKTGYEFLLIEITEGGIYKFTGGAPMTLFVFHDAYVGEAFDSTAPYTDNIHDITYEYVDHFYVNLSAPGYYWVGFRYDYVGELREFDINVALHTEHTFAEGKCAECGAADPNYVPPHEHKFEEGKCECGETDPNYVAPEQKPEEPKPEQELGFFQTILKAITDFFGKVGNFFSGIFGKIGGFFSGLFGGNK